MIRVLFKNMRFFVIPFLFVLLLAPVFVFADDLEVWTNKDAGMHPNGFDLKFLSNRDDARIFWTTKADASPAEGLMYEEPISIRRTTALWFFGFTPEPEVLSTPFQKVLFFVESTSGYEHFRIQEIDPKNDTITVKNYSRFAANLEGWKLISQEEEYGFEEITIGAEESLIISLDMKPVFSEVRLIAPDKNTKQIAQLPILRVGETWKCTSRRSETCQVVRNSDS